MFAHAGGWPDDQVRQIAFVFQSLESSVEFRVDSSKGPAEVDGLSDIVFDPTDMDAMVEQLEQLRQRHRDLDASIDQLKLSGGDDISIMGLKREKLRLKDRIAWLSAKCTPDIIA